MVEAMNGAEASTIEPVSIWRKGGIRIPEALTKYGLRKTSLYGLLGREIPFATVPGGRLIPVVAIELWLESRTVPAAPAGREK